MPYRDKDKERARSIRRRDYFRERARNPEVKKLAHARYAVRRSNEPGGNIDTVASVGERTFMERIEGAKWVGRPYDGECCFGKVDIKTSKPTNHLINRKKWKFHLTRQRGVVDKFILYCLDELSNIVQILVVPDKELNVNDITLIVGVKSKYDRYRMNL